MINLKFKFNNSKSKKELGISYIPLDSSIIDTAYDLIKKGKTANKLK